MCFGRRPAGFASLQFHASLQPQPIVRNYTYSGVVFQVKSSQVKSSQVKSSQVKSSQVKSSQVKSSQVKSSQVKSSQVKSSQVKSSQVKSSQVKSSPACHKAASWRSRQKKERKSATLQLYRIRHCVKLRLSMTSRLCQIHSEQNPFDCHDCVQSCTKSKKASRATSKKLLTHSFQLSIPEKRAKASRCVVQVFRALPGMRAPLGNQLIARLTHRSAGKFVTWCAKFQCARRHLQDQLCNCRVRVICWTC